MTDAVIIQEESTHKLYKPMSHGAALMWVYGIALALIATGGGWAIQLGSQPTSYGFIESEPPNYTGPILAAGLGGFILFFAVLHGVITSAVREGLKAR